MVRTEILEALKKSILDLNLSATLENVASIIEGDGTTTVQDGIDAVSDALGTVGRRFQDGEWFVTELVYAGEVAKAAMDRLAPLLAAGESARLGSIVVGTVAGDLHDLGKRIFANYAKGAGIKVVDLGVDVSTAEFTGAVKEHQPLALGMSCLLTVTAREVGNVIEELQRQGTREAVKVIIGGAALTEQFAADVGADAFAPDAVTGTDIVKRWAQS
jgi:methanogenic corrinoid protein MtbC1